MRTSPTPIEAALWRRLRDSQLSAFKFRRQTVLYPYVADFCCPAVGLIIELDGTTHDAAADAVRDTALLARGYQTLRFTNVEVGSNIEGVLLTILSTAQSRAAFPTPRPPPLKGRGSRKQATLSSSLLLTSPSGEGSGVGTPPKQKPQ